MSVIIAQSYEEMSQYALALVLTELMKPHRVNLSLTAGGTPKRLYELLIPLIKDKASFKLAHYYNFDEVPLEGQRFGATMEALNQQVYHPANLEVSQIHELNERNYEGYDAYLQEAGGLDLIVMGIGTDGHFCGNLSGTTDFDKGVYRVEFKEGTKTYSYLKNTYGEVPPYLVTFGPQTVLSAKKLVLLANGRGKAEIVKQALEGPIDPLVPASILRLHPNCVVILDLEAASLLTTKQ